MEEENDYGCGGRTNVIDEWRGGSIAPGNNGNSRKGVPSNALGGRRNQPLFRTANAETKNGSAGSRCIVGQSARGGRGGDNTAAAPASNNVPASAPSYGLTIFQDDGSSAAAGAGGALSVAEAHADEFIGGIHTHDDTAYVEERCKAAVVGPHRRLAKDSERLRSSSASVENDDPASSARLTRAASKSIDPAGSTSVASNADDKNVNPRGVLFVANTSIIMKDNHIGFCSGLSTFSLPQRKSYFFLVDSDL